MNHTIKVIKRGHRKEPEAGRPQPTNQPTREMTTTIKLWVSEFKERRQTEAEHSRKIHKLTLTAFSLGFVLLLGAFTEGEGQQLRDVFHKVDQSVVVIRTEEKELAPFPQAGTVSANGLGSGVLFGQFRVVGLHHLLAILAHRLRLARCAQWGRRIGDSGLRRAELLFDRRDILFVFG